MTENLINRISFYLASGGLFNPELADHIAVRTLLFECREALAQPERSMKVEGPLHVVCQCNKCNTQPEQEPVGKLQEATAERAWFTIAELNAWADKKLSENPHWVMPKDKPERDEPPPAQQEPVFDCPRCGHCCSQNKEQT